MKNILTKIGYMTFGCLLTLIGYHFGNIDNNSVNAQEALGTPVEIVNKLRVRQIEIVGNDNSPRIYLGTDLDRGQIKFVGDSDTSQMSLKATSNGGQIKLHNRSGKPKIFLDHKEDRGRIRILGENERGRVTLTENDNGGSVIVSSEDEKSIALLSIAESGPVVAADSEHGSVHLSILATPELKLGGLVRVESTSGGSAMLYAKDGNGIVSLHDEKGHPHASLAGDSDGGVLRLYDKSGKTLIYAGVTDESGGFLLTVNKDGTFTNYVGGKSTNTSTYQKKVIRRTITTRSLPQPKPVRGGVIQ